MKYFVKLIILCNILLLIGCKSLPHRQQLWAIALTGIMTEYNNDSHITLNSRALNERNKKEYLKILERDWGINNREELLETLEKMEHDGHAATFETIKQIINKINNNSLQPNEYELNKTDYNRLIYTVENWELYKDKTILAWDLGRNIALCRWGYDVGYLNKNEAWGKIMYFAKKIQPLYKSWEEYGTDYFAGRVFWASGFGAEEKYLIETEKIYKKLMSKSGHWYNMKWNIELD
jgi:hypothetical protein